MIQEMEEIEFKASECSLTLRRVPALPNAIDNCSKYVFTLDGREYRCTFRQASITAYGSLCMEFYNPRVLVHGDDYDKEEPFCHVALHPGNSDRDGKLVFCAPAAFAKVVHLVEADHPSVSRLLIEGRVFK